MKPYELTYIISSAEKSEYAENLKKDIESFVQKKGGIILKSVKTVPQSMAYPVKKQSSGYFVTLEFQAEEKEIKTLKELLEKNQKILRHLLVVKKPVKQMKERRTRKPVIEGKIKIKSEVSQVYRERARKKETKIELEDIDRKLDEILS